LFVTTGRLVLFLGATQKVGLSVVRWFCPWFRPPKLSDVLQARHFKASK